MRISSSKQYVRPLSSSVETQSACSDASPYVGKLPAPTASAAPVALQQPERGRALRSPGPSAVPAFPSMGEIMGMSDLELRLHALSTEELERTLATLEAWAPDCEAATAAFRHLWKREDLSPARKREAARVGAWEGLAEFGSNLPRTLIAGMTAPSALQRYVALIYMSLIRDLPEVFAGHEAQATAAFERAMQDSNGYVRWAALLMFSELKDEGAPEVRAAAKRMVRDPLPMLRALSLAFVHPNDAALMQQRRDTEEDRRVQKVLDVLDKNRAFDASVLQAPAADEDSDSDRESDVDHVGACAADRVEQILRALAQDGKANEECDSDCDDDCRETWLQQHFGGFSTHVFELCCGEPLYQISVVL